MEGPLLYPIKDALVALAIYSSVLLYPHDPGIAGQGGVQIRIRLLLHRYEYCPPGFVAACFLVREGVLTM